MNPEEGSLRPQIMDRFGLRVVVGGLTDIEERREVARRAQAYAENGHEFSARLAEATWQVAQDIEAARKRLPQVTVSHQAEEAALVLVNQLHVQSLRAEIVMLQAARARAAADEREYATIGDVVAVAPMVLRLRHSRYISEYIDARQQEDQAIQKAIDVLAFSGDGEDK
jgi:magnesium chelatase subunit I